MLPAPKGGSRARLPDDDTAPGAASMLPAPKGGSRFTRRILSTVDPLLQCCPPRRAGVGWRRTHSFAGSSVRFNAARPEGRESALPALRRHRDRAELQCCPPRRAGVGSGEGRPLAKHQPLQFCPPRRAGVGSFGALIVFPPIIGFNAARPEGRESDHRRRGGGCVGVDASMLPAPKGGSRGARSVAAHPRDRRFNAARPEGRESVLVPPATMAHVLVLQCCPPRRAGVGRNQVDASSLKFYRLQCCPPRRAGVGW